MNEQILAVLAWPTVVLALGLVAIGVFRSQIRQFLGRAQSFGKGWLVAAPPVQQLTGVVQSSEALDFLNLFGGELIRLQEKSIKEDMAARRLDSPGDAERVLLRALAAAQIALHFEQIHAVIWDGQVQLLETLNTTAEGIDYATIEAVYQQEFRGKRPFYAEIAFEVYLGWLREKTLVRLDEGRIALTVLGREYLKWMIDNGKSKRGIG